MSNKRASKNAYFFFALDMIPELRRRGLQVSGARDAIPLVSGDWALLSAEQREKYTEKAKMWKRLDSYPPGPERASGSGDQGKKCGAQHFLRSEIPVGDTQSSLMAEITDVLARQKIEESRRHSSYQERLLKKSEGLETKVIIVLNIFSHGEMPGLCEQRFVPCEIGCVRYSLKEGILDSFHDFIDPGELPLGFRYHCQAGSDNTHQIPVSGFQLANRDYHNLYRALCDFACPLPSIRVQVYCRNNDIYRVRWCLQWLAYKADQQYKLFELYERLQSHCPSLSKTRLMNRQVWLNICSYLTQEWIIVFEVLDIESLILKYYRDKLDEEPSRPTVNRLLDSVHWDYADNTRCKWHEENDMWYCALASCKKVTYCISKSLASVYGVTLTSAHLPSLMPQEKPSSNDNKTIILDARRYQKRDRYFTDNMDAGRAAGETSSFGMRGAVSTPISKGRGRGILRMLEEMPDFNPTEE